MTFNYQFSHSKKQEILLLISEFFLLIYELIICLPLSIRFKYTLKKINKKKRLFILGNGPSLQEDLKKIKKNSQLFVVNTFFSKKKFKFYKPNFLCCIDSMFCADYDRLSADIKIPVQKTFEELNKAKWNIIVFIPKKAKNIFKSRIKNDKVRIITIPTLSYDFESSFYLKFLSHLKLPPPKINVVIISIYIGMMFGAKNIQLIGVDTNSFHYFQTNQKTNETYTHYIHFSKSRIDIKKITEKYKDKKSKSMYTRLRREASIFKWYAYLSIVSKNLNLVLKNKSSYSLIDSIKR